MPELIVGLFPNHADVDKAINELQNKGYQPEDISIVFKNPHERPEQATTTGTYKAVRGATIGGLTGLLIGILASLIPGARAILFVGPLVELIGLSGIAEATFAGAAIGAAIGGVTAALEKAGIPREAAKEYEEKITQGAFLVAVPAKSGTEEETEAILNRLGAEQVRAIATK